MMIWFLVRKKLIFFYKKVNNELSDKNKNIFQETKKLFDLRVEIYKKLVFEEENLKFEKSIGETVKLKNQKDNLSETPEQNEFNDFLEQIKEQQKTINMNLFKEHFNFAGPTDVAKKLFKTKDKKENNELVEPIKVKWIDLKDEIKKMSKDEKQIEQPDKILEIVEEIIIFNRENQKQSGKVLKILTPDQMLSRLPITLAQSKAGNNSKKLKNEIRQSLYSLYRSNELTKQLCKSLIDII